MYIDIRCTATVPLSRDADSAEKRVSAEIMGITTFLLHPRELTWKQASQKSFGNNPKRNIWLFHMFVFLSGKTFPCFNWEFISWQQRPPEQGTQHLWSRQLPWRRGRENLTNFVMRLAWQMGWETTTEKHRRLFGGKRCEAMVENEIYNDSCIAHHSANSHKIYMYIIYLIINIHTYIYIERYIYSNIHWNIM